MSKKTKFYLKIILKFLFTITALYVIYLKVDVDELKALFSKKPSVSLLLGFLFFNLSQVISVNRFQCVLRAIDIHISYVFNLKLYYKAMFYNLFLPGGIGGDGFKYFYFKKHFSTTTKKLLIHLFADRVFGLVAILILIFILSFSINLRLVEDEVVYLLYLIIALLILIFYKLTKDLTFLEPQFIKLLVYSIVIQCLQLICFFFIIKHLGVNQSYLSYLSYLFLFLISSIASVLPISFGGLGAREAVFVYLSYIFFDAASNIGVAASLMFFIITAISSIIGNFIKIEGKTPYYKNT